MREKERASARIDAAAKEEVRRGGGGVCACVCALFEQGAGSMEPSTPSHGARGGAREERGKGEVRTGNSDEIVVCVECFCNVFSLTLQGGRVVCNEVGGQI